jgi:fatty acid desaturase
MNDLAAVFAPNILLLSGIAAADVAFLLREDSERTYWRMYLWTLIAVNLLYGVFGAFGYVFGLAGLLVGLWVYFVTFQKRQFTLLDLMLSMILLGCFGSMLATRMQAEGRQADRTDHSPLP